MSDNDKAAVKDVVEAYIEATFKGDVAGFDKVFHNNIVMNGYLGEQLVIGNADVFPQQMANMPSLESSGAPYKASIDAIELSGRIASATLNETGFGDMSFTNYFHLIKENEDWRIISKTFTTL